MPALRSPHLIVTLLALGAVACGKGSKSAAPAAPPGAARPTMPTGPAEYTVIIKSTWTKTSHPFEYPSGAHFSGMIGASHNAKYSIFAIGRRPTPGLERLSEEGKHSPLDRDERVRAIDAHCRDHRGLPILETTRLEQHQRVALIDRGADLGVERRVPPFLRQTLEARRRPAANREDRVLRIVRRADHAGEMRARRILERVRRLGPGALDDHGVLGGARRHGGTSGGRRCRRRRTLGSLSTSDDGEHEHGDETHESLRYADGLPAGTS